MPARAEAVVVVAGHLSAVAIEMDADRPAPAAARAGTTMATWREGGSVDGCGGHGELVYHGTGERVPLPPAATRVSRRLPPDATC
jgi:hypothetical protein